MHVFSKCNRNEFKIILIIILYVLEMQPCKSDVSNFPSILFSCIDCQEAPVEHNAGREFVRVH